MLITNLTGKQSRYAFDPTLIEESLGNIKDKISFDERLFSATIYAGLADVNENYMPFFTNINTYTVVDIIRQIPIYLITKQQSLKFFDVAFLGYKDHFLVPCHYLDKYIPDCSEIEEEDYKDLDPYIWMMDRHCETTTSIDPWGIYMRDYPTDKSRYCGMDEMHPRIFIWVDKIYDFVQGDTHKYQLLVSNVILHELAHAMIDVNLIGPHIHETHNSFNKTFYILKEESLATAISLSMMQSNISESDWDFLVSAVNQQPFQYKLGLVYQKLPAGALTKSINSWMCIKKSTIYSHTVADEWVKYVCSKCSLLATHIYLLDWDMSFSNSKI